MSGEVDVRWYDDVVWFSFCSLPRMSVCQHGVQYNIESRMASVEANHLEFMLQFCHFLCNHRHIIQTPSSNCKASLITNHGFAESIERLNTQKVRGGTQHIINTQGVLVIIVLNPSDSSLQALSCSHVDLHYKEVNTVNLDLYNYSCLWICKYT